MYRYRFVAVVTAALVTFVSGTATAFAMPAPLPDDTGRAPAPPATVQHAAIWPVVAIVIAAVALTVLVVYGAVRARRRHSATLAPAY